MAGIYIHIPFCRKLCYYCDFHFTVSLKNKSSVLKAIGRELELRKEEFSQSWFNTIYFGGGTPSILSINEINCLIEKIYQHYKILANPEVSFEVNPDDLNQKYLYQLKNNTMINRLSIGVQSFNDAILKFMNRRHTAEEAYSCIKNARSIGFKNINIDLIYGIPGMGLDDWKKNLKTFTKLNIPHLSAYHLSIEPKTVFAHLQKKGMITPITERESSQQFDYLMKVTFEKGYDHYEISNFAFPDHYSKHNIGYWTGEPYLGIGPSAHSFNGKLRRWNISNNTQYVELLEKGENTYYQSEEIDQATSFHDYLITALRTKWGINLQKIEQQYGIEFVRHIEQSSMKFFNENLLINQNGNIFLSNKGKLIADYIIREMMIIN